MFTVLASGLVGAIVTTNDLEKQESSIPEARIERAIARAEARKNVTESIQSDLEAVRSIRVPFERIAFDLRMRSVRGRSTLNQAYLDRLSRELEYETARRPKAALALLRAYLENGRTTEKRWLALIVLRETYPKKFSIFYADRMVNAPEALIARTARDILDGSYAVRGLGETLKNADAWNSGSPVL